MKIENLFQNIRKSYIHFNEIECCYCEEKASYSYEQEDLTHIPLCFVCVSDVRNISYTVILYLHREFCL